jgi:squalene-hopene/tetraprenyl-beta-curcumene cyclase
MAFCKCALLAFALEWSCAADGPPKPRPQKKNPPPTLQYQGDTLTVPAASPDEPRVKAFGPDSVRAARKYLDDGAQCWMESHGCIACHTSGVYMAERPGLSKRLGMPPRTVHDDFVAETPAKIAAPQLESARKSSDTHSLFAVWRSLGLAEWDQHVEGKLSAHTDRSLRDMLRLQRDNGLLQTSDDLEIPYVTTDFELTVQAARALATAPGWLKDLRDDEMRGRVARLTKALREHRPRNDFERALQLKLTHSMPDAVTAADRQAALAMLRAKQRADGGWSTRGMSAIDNWRDHAPPRVLELLRAEPDSADPASDPYMTAFAIVQMRAAGVPAADPQVRRGIAWLKAEQRQSGRWWMRSMYKHTYRFITFIATAQTLRALDACGELPDVRGP